MLIPASHTNPKYPNTTSQTPHSAVLLTGYVLPLHQVPWEHIDQALGWLTSLAQSLVLLCTSVLAPRHTLPLVYYFLLTMLCCHGIIRIRDLHSSRLLMESLGQHHNTPSLDHPPPASITINHAGRICRPVDLPLVFFLAYLLACLLTLAPIPYVSAYSPSAPDVLRGI